MSRNAASIHHVRRLCTESSSAISISKAKSRLRSEFDPDKALEIYSSLSKHYASPLASRYAQDLTVRRLAKSRRFSDIENLIESQKKDPNIAKEPFLSTLIRSYGCAGMFDHAMKTYDQMDDLGTPRSAISFNALLFACNQCKLWNQVHKLFDEIPKKYNVVPDEVSYGILVKSFCQVGQPQKTLETLKEVEDKGLEVTVVTYTTILDSLHRKGESEEAEKLWNLMQEKVCIDTTAYNVKLRFAGEPGEVKALIDEMINAGLKPDAISYNNLITCYFKCEMVKEAKEVYMELERKGCHPNAATFRTMVYYLCRNEDFEGGYKVFKESVKMHKIPDFSTVKILAEGLVKNGKKKEAKEMIRTIKKKFPPNVLKTVWDKVEKDLNLASVDADDNDKAEEASA